MSAFGKFPLFIDVGASDGRVMKTWIEKCPTAHIYGFEPAPERFKKLERLSNNHPNIQVSPIAISSKNGKADFYISNSENYSSLYPHKTESIKKWKYPPGRRFFRNKETIQVETKRLDAFLKDKGFKFVDFLKINTRGHDLEVVKSLGHKYIKNVREIVVNVSLTDFDLYEGQTNQKDAVVKYLEDKGFKEWKSEFVSKKQEANMYFTNTRFSKLANNQFYHLLIPY